MHTGKFLGGLFLELFFGGDFLGGFFGRYLGQFLGPAGMAVFGHRWLAKGFRPFQTRVGRNIEFFFSVLLNFNIAIIFGIQ